MHQEMRQLRVLLVDDNAALRGALRVSLTAFGCARVLEADTVEKALAALGSQPIDLVITDWMMPRLDGLGLVRALRAEAATEGVPIIMLTAKGREVEKEKGMALGANDYVTKPFSTSELTARVKELLGDN